MGGSEGGEGSVGLLMLQPCRNLSLVCVRWWEWGGTASVSTVVARVLVAMRYE